MSMIKNWLPTINAAIGGIAILLVLVAGGMMLTRPWEIPVEEVVPKPKVLPRRGFGMAKEKYEAIGEPFLELEFSPVSMQLPDLRRFLTYYGRNDRPDAKVDEVEMHFGFNRSKESTSVKSGKRLYLQFDASKKPGSYLFSPDNAETSLWITATPKGAGEVIVDVSAQGEDDQVVRTPKEYAQFILKGKEFMRMRGAKWELNGFRVDASLLARQRARWYGKDQFIDKHGGEEFLEWEDKQRIDFGDGEERYAVYVDAGDLLVWENGKWRRVSSEEDSSPYPLMRIQAVEDRLMKLELWDVDGKGKVALNLLKSSEAWVPQSIYRNFKFIGARTRSQFVFEIDNERILLSPQDWLLRTEEGWKKLETAEDIDNFVNRKEVGVLFVLDGVQRIGGRQVLIGTLFNSTRTDSQLVELPIQQSGATFSRQPEKEEEEETEAQIRIPEIEEEEEDEREE